LITCHQLIWRQVFRAHRRTVEAQQATSLEDAVDDGLRQVVVVEDGAPLALRV